MNDRLSRRRFVTAGGAAMVAGLAGCSQSEGGDAGDGSSDGASTDTTSSADTVKIGVLERTSQATSRSSAIQSTRPRCSPSRRSTPTAASTASRSNRSPPTPSQITSATRELTREYINEEEVDVLWAGYSSATREAIRPIINRNEAWLYFYTTQYEGGVCDSTTFAVGPTARQQLRTVLPYLREEFGPGSTPSPRTTTSASCRPTG